MVLTWETLKSQDISNDGFTAREYKEYNFSVNFPGDWKFEKTREKAGDIFFIFNK